MADFHSHPTPPALASRPDALWPLALQNLPHEHLTDPEQVIAAMAPVAPMTDFQLHTTAGNFHWRKAHLPLQQAPLTTKACSDLSFRVDHSPAVHLMMCIAGWRRWITPRGTVENRRGGALLLPPGERHVFGSQSGAVFTLQPAAIAATAEAMVGQEGTGSEATLARNRSRSFAPQVIQPQLAVGLHHLLRWIDQCLACHHALPDQLGAGDIVLRQVAALLDPSLLQEQPGEGERLRERQGRSAFDDLIDHIRANLDQPLRLSDLEARSHYSRRALHYAFQQKLGCSPMAWIRGQRLERAMKRLRTGGPEVTVKAVALACGYRYAGHFSTDFQRRFGITPSEARRAPL
ncbi:MAG: helix-turn-helix transcriptional regulator [Synechococcaceae cyanobacterium]|nr:helix-turn-helix transcriptional regulator [Synechococcaceae cyanobacterium]